MIDFIYVPRDFMDELIDKGLNEQLEEKKSNFERF